MELLALAVEGETRIEAIGKDFAGYADGIREIRG
jgi:hypothetical protein